MNTEVMKSSAVEIIKLYLGDTKILNLEIKNKWLVATLENCRFRILNI